MTNNSYDYESLFNPQVEQEKKKSQEVYTPSADKGQGGVYTSLIRFVSWWENPSNSYIDKWVCYLKDPLTNKGRYIDCPSTVHKPSPLQDMFFKYYKHESVQEREKAKIFSRHQSVIAIIQVIKDDNAKDLEGKLLIYRFGQKIFSKIDAERNPVYGDVHNPFNLINGKLFQLKITTVNKQNNYDQCKFLDKSIPLCMLNENNKMVPINEKTDKQVVLQYLKDNSPDLNKYKYQDWDSETYDYVNNVILQVTGSPTPASSIHASLNEQTRSSDIGNKNMKSADITSQNLSIEDLNFDDDFSNPKGITDPMANLNPSDIGGSLDDAFLNL